MWVWVTKYALTRGIMHLHAEQLTQGNIRVTHASGETSILIRKEWHYTKELAIAQARQMRDKQVTKLKRKITALKAMEF